MRWYDPLLYPFAILYGAATRLRNRMFDTGQKKSISFTIPTIVVGNLSMGGTGKTPMVEWLIENLSADFQLATLSRGYGRKTKGFVKADASKSPSDIGDEPYQIYTKYGQNVAVTVGEERILAIPQIIVNYPSTELVLLDDAFQHRYVKGDFNILLTTFQRPFYMDKIIPLGTLREASEGAARADVVVVTKCPVSLDKAQKADMINAIGKFTDPNCPVIFAGLKYGEPYSVFGGGKINSHKVVLLSGIANDGLLISEVQRKYEVVEIYTYPDHHHYTIEDIKKLHKQYLKDNNLAVITTEKDAVKLKDPKFREYLAEIPIFALPIQVNISVEDQEYLINRITKIVQDKAYIREI